MEKKKRTKLLPIIILLGAIVLSFGMASLKSSPAKEERKEKAVLVEVKEISRETINSSIKGTGIVRSVSEVSLVPEVAGKIIFKAQNFVNGASFKKGDLLYRIDPRDYVLQVKAAQADLANAEVRYQIEQEETDIAKDEWAYYQKKNPNEKANSLTLRKPQLALAKASLDAAKTRLEIAKLNLERTYIKAPFNGSVRTKYVDANQYIAPGTKIAEIFSTEFAQIDIAIDPEELAWIDQKTSNKAMVSLLQNGKKHSWSGKLINTGSSLDKMSRLVSLTVEVSKPYEREKSLLNGAFVEVIIEGKKLTNVFLIPRYALHNDKVYLMVNKKLKIVDVEFLRVENENAVIRADFPDQSKLVLSNLIVAEDSISLRTE
jgi:membrane fusion protein, multidrug efflux system